MIPSTRVGRTNSLEETVKNSDELRLHEITHSMITLKAVRIANGVKANDGLTMNPTILDYGQCASAMLHQKAIELP